MPACPKPTMSPPPWTPVHYALMGVSVVVISSYLVGLVYLVYREKRKKVMEQQKKFQEILQRRRQGIFGHPRRLRATSSYAEVLSYCNSDITTPRNPLHIDMLGYEDTATAHLTDVLGVDDATLSPRSNHVEMFGFHDGGPLTPRSNHVDTSGGHDGGPLTPTSNHVDSKDTTPTKRSEPMEMQALPDHSVRPLPKVTILFS